MSASEAESAVGVRTGYPTNERTYGRTDVQQWEPTRDNSPSVTRTRTYGISHVPLAHDRPRLHDCAGCRYDAAEPLPESRRIA